MSRSPLLLVALAAALACLCSCTSLEREMAPGRSTAGLRTFHVERLQGEEWGLHQIIAEELALMGYTASAGEPGTAPRNVDAVVNYWDQWYWDMAPYLLQLRITFHDPGSRSMIAKGESYRPSLFRRSPRAMAKEVLGEMLQPTAAE